MRAKKSVQKRTRPSSRNKSSKKSKRQPADRWSPRLVKGGWTPVSDYFLKNYHRLNITNNEAMVIIHLMLHKWDAAAPFPALKTLAKRMGMETPSVRAHLRNLDRKGLLFRKMKTGTTNRFHLDELFRSLEKLMDQDAESESESDDEDE